MHLQLAIVLSCTEAGCQVQLDGSTVPIHAGYSDALIENAIIAGPGGLVATDGGARPPRIVFLPRSDAASPSESGLALTEDARPVSPDHVRAETNRQLVEEAGLHLVSARHETAEQHGQPITFLWVVARNDRGHGDH